MKLVVPAAAQAAATLPLFPEQSRPDTQSALFQAGTALAQALGQGHALDARTLRAAMETAFGGSDAEGAWDWKLAYDACEAAQVLFLRKFGPAMRARAGSPAAFLAMLGKLAALLPVADPTLRGIPGASAILDADRARLRRRHGCGNHAGRSRAGAIGRHRPARHLRRACRSEARSE